jgi:hypothetical protein
LIRKVFSKGIGYSREKEFLKDLSGGCGKTK